MDWSSWRRYFERNGNRPPPRLPAAARGLPADWLAPLAASLATFQLGESKGGRLVDQIAAASFPGIDDDYRAAVRLFVGEEQRHGDILAAAVEALGGRLVDRTWTETAFIGLRRSVGVRGKLLVLLAAEVIGLGFYRTIASRLPPGQLRAALEEMCADEVAHLAFHRDFFATQLRSPAARVACAGAWWVVAGAAGAAVAIDHRETLRALGIPWWELAERFAGLIAGASPGVRHFRPRWRSGLGSSTYSAVIVWTIASDWRSSRSLSMCRPCLIRPA